MSRLVSFAATVAVGLGVCSLAASVMAPLALGDLTSWLLAGGGFVALIAGLVVLWVLLRERDLSLW
jgi:hypothetical protein